jgi:glutaminase
MIEFPFKAHERNGISGGIVACVPAAFSTALSKNRANLLSSPLFA